MDVTQNASAFTQSHISPSIAPRSLAEQLQRALLQSLELAEILTDRVAIEVDTFGEVSAETRDLLARHNIEREELLYLAQLVEALHPSTRDHKFPLRAVSL